VFFTVVEDGTMEKSRAVTWRLEEERKETKKNKEEEKKKKKDEWRKNEEGKGADSKSLYLTGRRLARASMLRWEREGAGTEGTGRLIF